MTFAHVMLFTVWLSSLVFVGNELIFISDDEMLPPVVFNLFEEESF